MLSILRNVGLNAFQTKTRFNLNERMEKFLDQNKFQLSLKTPNEMIKVFDIIVDLRKQSYLKAGKRSP